MRNEVTEEFVEMSADQWWWVAESESEMETTYHVVRVNADSDGVCNFQFNSPSFSCTDFSAWMYENGNLGGSFSEDQIICGKIGL